MAGRTWLQHATPITFGVKAAGWLEAIERSRGAIEERARGTFVLQFGGASGTLAALARAIDSVREAGARAVQLPISVPGHFPKMSEAREELRKFIDNIEFHDPKSPVVSSLTGRILS